MTTLTKINEIYDLRQMFGPVCEALTITSRTSSLKARKNRPGGQVDGRTSLPRIEANCCEEIAAVQVIVFIAFKVRDQGLRSKTANHFRSILRRVFNWATEQRDIRLPSNVNPAGFERSKGRQGSCRQPSRVGRLIFSSTLRA